ncbi:hypothetical protein [Micromonospora tarensis]|uniref:Phage tail protein n=1 Tax=Micromonospora tarensis TaxID=2806100 RepID=A0ABS1YDN7_9ACTN|nr:hypothetical protein [Micromonospora tarensis]MBM0275326.1 hypothetical protein [Micromonospora tarensis]
MARLPGPAVDERVFYYTSGSRVGRMMPAGIRVPLYADLACTQPADVRALDGGTLPTDGGIPYVVINASLQAAEFLFPDVVDPEVYTRVLNGPVIALHPSADSQLDVFRSGFTSMLSQVTAGVQALGTYDSRLTVAEGQFASQVGRLTAIEADRGIAVYKSGNNITVRSRFDATRDVLMPIVLVYSLNACVGFWHAGLPQVNLVATAASDASVFPVLQGGVGTPIHDMSDDNCPINIRSASDTPSAALGFSYIGGNHGYNYAARIAGGAAHGKTTADLGSQWTDSSGTRIYTLIRIVSTTEAWWAYPYDPVTGAPVATGPAGTTLTHVSGATNTATVNLASVLTPGWQITPAIQTESVVVQLDGKALAEGKTLGNTLTITETYVIPTYGGLVATARANVGVPFQNLWAQMPKLCRITNTYRWSANGTLMVSQRVAALSSFRLSMGATQMFPLTAPAGGARRQAMPNVGTAGTLDWTTFANINTLPGGNTAFTSAVALDPAYPAQSATQWAEDASGTRVWGIAIGYLPIGDAHPSVRAGRTTYTPWFMSGSFKKNYPQVVWAHLVNDGDEIAATAYRRYLPPPQGPTEIVVSDGTHDFAIIERVGSTGYTRMLAPDLINRKLVPAGPVTLATPDRVGADGIPYATAGYGVWRAEPDVTVDVSNLPPSDPTLAAIAAMSTDVQVFTANGTFTLPAGAKTVRVIGWGGGPGGGSGRRGAPGTACGGGGGGAGAGFVDVVLPASIFSATHAITVGAAGLGGAAVLTDDTNGNPGGNGFGTIIAGIMTIFGGLGGAGGAVGGGIGGASLTGSSSPGATGGNGSSPGGSVGNPINAGFAGAGGGGISAANVASNGGGFGFNPTTAGITNGAAGTVAGTKNGGNGGNAPLGSGLMGGAAGGGAASLDSAAGDGGNGGRSGAAGSGGGASRNGFASGKGGDGSPGFLMMITSR